MARAAGAGGARSSRALDARRLLGAVLQYETFMFSQGFPEDDRGNRGAAAGMACMLILML